MKLLIVAATIGSVFILVCENTDRKLPGGYRLERFEQNGRFYVVDPGASLDAGGTFEGTVTQIGWNDNCILARVTRTFRGDPDGWYALDVKTRQIRGPLSEGELAADPVLAKIQRKTVAGQ